MLNKAETELLRDLVLYDFQFYFEQIAFPNFKLSKKHVESFYAWDGAKANLLLGFPGSSKSSCLHTARHAWLANRNRWEVQNGLATRPMVFLSGSYNATTAMNLFTRNIKRQLALPIMAFLFGQMIDPNCADAGFNLLGLDYSHEKDNAVQAFGALEGNVAGLHGDILTLDDAITLQAARSGVMRMSFAEKVPVDIRRILRRPPHKFAGTEREPQFNVLGYVLHSMDFYADLQDKQKNPDFEGRVHRWPALDHNGESFFPEMYSTETVLNWKLNTPPATWQSVYMQDASGAKGDVIKDSWLRWWADEPVPEKLQVFVGVDLAVKQTEHADYCAFYAQGFDPVTRKRWELGQEFGRWTFDERCRKLKEFCGRWKNNVHHRLAKVGVEAPASGSDVVLVLQKQTDLNIAEVKVTRDKLQRLVEKSHLFEQGKIILQGPARNDVMPGVGDWAQELLSFRHDIPPPPPAHDDRTDAFLIAESLISPSAGEMTLTTAGPRRQTQEALARF